MINDQSVADPGKLEKALGRQETRPKQERCSRTGDLDSGWELFHVSFVPPFLWSTRRRSLDGLNESWFTKIYN